MAVSPASSHSSETSDVVKVPSHARDKALSIVEILEPVLSSLDLRDLVRIQSVNRLIHQTISESRILQQKLFLEPLSASAVDQPVLNPLHTEMFPTLFALNRPAVNRFGAPLFASLPGAVCEDYDETDTRLGWIKDPVRRERVLRPDASWRRMLPIQPPAKLGEIKIYSYERCNVHGAEGTPARLGSRHQHLQSEGIRMGLLFDLAAQLHSLHPRPSFFVHWQMFPLVDATDDASKDPLRYTWYPFHKRHFGPLFADSDPPPLRNTITLYHNHESFCGLASNDRKPSGLTAETPFLLAVQQSPDSMIDFLGEPNVRATRWGRYGSYATEISQA